MGWVHEVGEEGRVVRSRGARRRGGGGTGGKGWRSLVSLPLLSCPALEIELCILRGVLRLRLSRTFSFFSTLKKNCDRLPFLLSP